MAEAADTPGDGSGGPERHLPVLAGPSALPIARRPSALPVPAAVAAGGGFLAGVAALTLVRLLRPRRRRSLRRRAHRREQALEVAATRSFIVDVHLLKR